MDIWIPHLESACRILGIMATLLGAPKVFHTYYAILGMMWTRCEVCYCTLCLHKGYESLCVPDYNALYRIGFDWFIWRTLVIWGPTFCDGLFRTFFRWNVGYFGQQCIRDALILWMCIGAGSVYWLRISKSKTETLATCSNALNISHTAFECFQILWQSR